MPYALKKTGNPSEYPVTLTQAKAHLRIIGTAEDTLLTAMIIAATEDAEHESGLQFVDAQYTLYLDHFPGLNYEPRYRAMSGFDVVSSTADRFPDDTIRLPIGNVTSVTSISYRAANGDQTTLDASQYYAAVNTQRIVPVTYWPTTDGRPENVVVVFRAGYANAAAVPALISAAILLILGDRYEKRGDDGESLSMPVAAKRILGGLSRGNLD